MSLHVSVVAIEGDRLEELPELFERCNYQLCSPPTVVGTGAEAAELLKAPPEGADRVVKAAYREGGWTVIVDPELVIMTEEEVLEECSRRWQAKVLCWVCEGVSGTYGLSLYDGGKVRGICTVDGAVEEDTGDPLPAEAGVDWASAFEDDVLAVAEKLGAPYRYLEADTEYRVYVLGAPDMGELAPGQATPDAPPPARKPRWKFW